MIDIHKLKIKDKVKVYDYTADVLDEIVTIVMIDIISNDIVYERSNGEQIYFLGQGYFEYP